MISRLRRRAAGSVSLLVSMAAVASTVPLLAGAPTPAAAVSPDIVISEVYGGGGNSGATLTHDFVELFNRGSAPVDVTGWSVQYTSATGTGTFSPAAVAGVVPPGGRFLVQLAAGAGGTQPLPTPDATGNLALSGTAGKVAVVRDDTALRCNGGSDPCTPEELALIVDLVGYGTANFAETAPAPATSNTTSVSRGNACVDTDNNAADFVAGAPTPQSSAAPAAPCDGTPPADAAPAVTAIVPANGTANVGVGTSVTVTFSEPVTVADGGITLTCTAGGAVAGTVSSADHVTHTFDPTAELANDDTCTIGVSAAAVTDADANDPPDTLAADVTSAFSTAVADPCSAPITPIPAIQGADAATPIPGTIVRTRGVVVSDDEGPSPALRGFNLQDPAGDGDETTSDGIFVFNGAGTDLVSNGDVVTVTGRATEFNGQTQIDQLSSVVVCGTGTVAPTDVTLPFAATTTPERYEGMLVQLPQTLSVTEHFQLGRFGEVVVSSGGRLQQPTNVVAPGVAALALQAENDRNRILIDDNRTDQNPDVIRLGRGGQPLSASNTLRGGDTVTGVVGVIGWSFGAYRVMPFNALGGGAPDFQPANPRPAGPPAVGGRIQVAGMNVLNYFNTFDPGCTAGVGGAPIECRGADSAEEFARQVPKTVAAIVGTGAEVIGINEIENDGYGPDSAIAQLVGALNEATAPGTYAFIDADAGTGQVNSLGTDAIKVGLIYQPALVTPTGTTAALNTVEFVNGGDGAPRSRPALAQAFTENSTGAVFTTVVNHLKSKGSECDAPDAGDGQGNCNDVRVNSVNRLLEWLAGDPTGTGDPDVLLVGDLNAYAREDPITTLEAAGYTDLVERFVGADAYSYVFGGQWGYLDHALGSPSIVSQVTGVGEWHINADEPLALDYNTDFKSAALAASLYAPDEFRSSDHDPAIVGLDLTAPQYEVSGAGTFRSPKGAVADRPNVPGIGAFALWVRTTTEGGTLGAFTFTLPPGKLTAYAIEVDTFSVDEATATLTGPAIVNGRSGSTYEIVVTDGRPDTIHVILRDASGAVTYDSGAQPLKSGSVSLRQLDD